MSELSDNPSLKDITAQKKKINWGEVPSIYHMASSSIGDIDSILSHGFESAYKHLLNRKLWNLELLGGQEDVRGNIKVERKPQISLMHIYGQEHHELHCFPIIDGERIHSNLVNDPNCPFIQWSPESMQMLFRVNNLVTFIIYAFKSGDEADFALIKYAHKRVEELIQHLSCSFDIIEIKGMSIAHFCKEIHQRKSNFNLSDLLDSQLDEMG